MIQIPKQTMLFNLGMFIKPSGFVASPCDGEKIMEEHCLLLKHVKHPIEFLFISSPWEVASEGQSITNAQWTMQCLQIAEPLQ